MTEELREKRPRGIYLLPNLFTTASLFAGFYAIIAAMQGSFDVATFAIFVAMLMDSLDGRVARLTNTQTEFGVQYDSLADMVSFGIAPAVLVYSWSLFSIGKLGWLAAFLFAATTALRLARFNTQVEHADKRYFQGMPSPAGAGVLTSVVLFGHHFHLPAVPINFLMAIITVGTGLLMVSNIRFYSFKEIDFKGRVPFVAIFFVLSAFIAIALNPPMILFLGFFGYALSGIVLTLWGLHQRRKERKNSHCNESKSS
jgi:CDP-diacylglycerol--serine O-phosphatidyltransferase